MRNSEIIANASYQSAQIKLNKTEVYRKYQPDSIQIDYQPDAVLEIKGTHPFQPFSDQGKDQARDTFCFWIYQSKPASGQLKFIFKKNETSCCFFTFGLNFTGWRTAWLIYERDMQGQPQIGMDAVRIEFPAEAGSLYLTDLDLAAKIDPRHPTPDYQVPQVNPNIGASGHWMCLHYFEECRKAVQAKDRAELAETQNDYVNVVHDTATIKQRQKAYLLEKYRERRQRITYVDLKERLEKYHLKEQAGRIFGVSVDSVYTMEILPKPLRSELIEAGISIDMRRTGSLLLDLALHYEREKSEAVGGFYLRLSKHLINQGLAYGSSLGTSHHYGYVLKEMFDSIFLMADFIKNQDPGLLKDLIDMTVWMTGLGRLEVPTEECSINIDILNTYSHAMLMAILFEGDLAYRYRLLFKYSEWLNASIDYAKGLEGTFKPDGSMYHHANHYPAYGLDGLKSLTPLIYFLAGTCAEISSKAYAIVENAMEKLRWYCNLKHWPTALSARHPKTDGEHTHLTSEVFYYMTLAEMISGKRPNMGNIYLRLEGEMSRPALEEVPEQIQKRVSELLERGYCPEQTPTGHLTMNLACAGFHRRGEWLAAIRGHNRYLWSHESYVANNLYGRYVSFNHLQILSQGRPITLQANGYQAEGFNWNSFAGTTVIELPFAELKSKVYNVDAFSGYEEMLLTDEIYAGGLTLGENGMFAIKLHGHAKYDDSHRANLSTFFFDDTIIRLGSEIESADEIHRSITTLFQSLSRETPFYVNGQPICDQEYFYSKDVSGLVLSDAYRNGYYLPGALKVEIQSGLQSSPAQDGSEPKSGHFTRALIDHGPAPKNEAYEYVIGVNQRAEDFYQKALIWQENPFYKVHQKDKQAHILEHYPSNTFAYALFVAGEIKSNSRFLKSCDRPCLCMIRQQDQELALSFCDPDLRLYEGRDEEQYDENGRQIECSVYSRKWMHHPSIGKQTKIVLNGLFEVKDPVLAKDLQQTGLLEISHDIKEAETSLIFWGIQGGETEILLYPLKQ
ncbi:hypothetical protein EII17_11810 [Clostridiales bacterium COT073_COT-073]|nr:hypothetical protein EII17_11810 [Clostridiales bacterium COT073_COT-073]